MKTIEQLQREATRCGVTLSPDQADALLRYLELLKLWNQKFNLTSITDLDEMITKHILDSLVIAPYIQGENIIDVGTGAGLPGLVLAIIFPEKHWVLLDSNQKKIRFLLQAKAQLKLSNIEPVASRVESYEKPEGFDMILSRAFTSLENMLQQTKHLCRPGGSYLAMKGQYPEEELAALNEPSLVITVHELQVPGLNAKRHAVLMRTHEEPCF